MAEEHPKLDYTKHYAIQPDSRCNTIGIRPRLLFIAPSAYTLGGVQIWLNYILPGLESCGFDVHLGLVEGDHHRPEAYILQHSYQKVHSVVPKQFTATSRRRAIVALLEDLRPEMVVGVNISDVYGLSQKDLNAAGNPKIIASNHALEAAYFYDFKEYRSGLDAVICTNKLSALLCREISGLPETRVFYAPYGVDAGNRSLSMQSSRLRVGFAGRLEEPQKRVSDLTAIVIQARREGLDFDLAIAGDGPLRDEVVSTLGKHLPKERLMYLGHVPKDEMDKAFYSKIDVLLITSSWETGPIVAWEAMGHGLVVLTARYLGAKAEAALEDGRNCRMFDIGDIAGAVEALKDLKNADYRQSLSEGGMALVTERYSIDASVSRWGEVLSTIYAMNTRAGTETDPSEPRGLSRLDRIFGKRAGDLIRERLMPRRSALNPGAEWPHAYSRSKSDKEFWTVAETLESSLMEDR